MLYGKSLQYFVLLQVVAYSLGATIQLEEEVENLNEQCLEKPARGQCGGKYERWYYNSETSKCQRFTYGGCGGNNNRFLTWGRCQLKCPYIRNANPDCTEPKATGFCYGSLTRYYYNTVTERCQKFTYTGCHGNNNRFATKRECETNCPARPGCLEPKKRGPCKRYEPRFYFNRATKQCEHFMYGGCQANQNNFKAKADCEAECPIEVRKGSIYGYTWFLR